MLKNRIFGPKTIRMLVCAIRVRVILLRSIFVMFQSFGPSMLLFLDCLLSPFDIFELSTFIRRFFRIVHYPLKIMFDISLGCITLLLITNFSSEVRIFNFSDNFSSSFKLFNFNQAFPTSPCSFQLRSVLFNFARLFSTWAETFQLQTFQLKIFKLLVFFHLHVWYVTYPPCPCPLF